MMGDRVRRGHLFLLGPVVAVLSVSASYLLAHPYPALGGGLYLTMAETISGAGYALPERIPHYTAGGIPFGYPPLLFYVTAVLLDLGVPGLTFVRLFPVVPLTAAVVVYAHFAQEVLGNYGRGAVAATVIATAPTVLQYTLSAGGFVRATGLTLVTVGLVTGLGAFRDGSRRSTALSTVVFALVLVTHLKYALFLGTTYLVFYSWFDRTATGFLRGVCVAGGGLALTAPWWATVVSTHGIELFLAASTTHGGVGNLWVHGFLDVSHQPVPSLWPVLVSVSVLYLVARREWFLPLWFVATGVVVGNHEHLLLVGGLMITTLLFDGLVPSLRDHRPTGEHTPIEMPDTVRGHPVADVATVLLVGGLLLYAGWAAVSYAGSGDSDGGVVFVDDQDVNAMEWTETNTRPGASFVVVGDAAEWFPYVSNRTSLVAGRGSEWTGQYQSMTATRAALSSCLSADCVTDTMADADVRPDYVYVARDGYMVFNNRGLMDERWRLLPPSLDRSPRYEQVYRNQGVVLFRYTAARGE